MNENNKKQVRGRERQTTFRIKINLINYNAVSLSKANHKTTVKL